MLGGGSVNPCQLDIIILLRDVFLHKQYTLFVSSQNGMVKLSTHHSIFDLRFTAVLFETGAKK